MMGESVDLFALRDTIEQLDRDLLDLLKRRMELADAIAQAKLATASPLRDPPREERVLARVRSLAVERGLDPHAIESLYRHVMEMSVARQQTYVTSLSRVPLRVAYPGVEGSYSHLAARRRYAGRAGGALLVGAQTIREAADTVRRGEVDLALIPIENTTAGSMNETYDVLAESGLHITGEALSAVEHRLLLLPGARLEDLREVRSHPQAFEQCAAFLRALPLARLVPELDTAGAARHVRERGDPTCAAIASESAAQRFGLVVHPQELHDGPGQFTRFVEVAREPVACATDGTCKTSLMLSLDHRPGALGEILVELSRQGVNVSKLESRPVPGASFRYRFYLDLEAHAQSAPVRAALLRIREMTSELRILGTYAASEA